MNDRRPATILLLGGFLGAGKTTVGTNLVNMLWNANTDAAFITNDQSDGLVDTEVAKSLGLHVKEISGGCFCCKCNEFALALDELSALRQVDYIIAEAVGSCTDLIATVVEPLRRDLNRPYKVLPLVVVVDPARLEQFISSHDGAEPLHDDVDYIFFKQLEEAQIILLNKSDAHASSKIAELAERVKQVYPKSEVLPFSGHRRRDIAKLWDWLLATAPTHTPLPEIDYERYASGEMQLGWLNADYQVSAGKRSFTFTDICVEFSQLILEEHRSRSIELAHLKVSCSSLTSVTPMVAVVQSISSSSGAIVVRRDDHAIESARVLINIRSRTSPDTLMEVLRGAEEYMRRIPELLISEKGTNSFAPAAPNPPYVRRDVDN